MRFPKDMCPQGQIKGHFITSLGAATYLDVGPLGHMEDIPFLNQKETEAWNLS